MNDCLLARFIIKGLNKQPIDRTAATIFMLAFAAFVPPSLSIRFDQESTNQLFQCYPFSTSVAVTEGPSRESTVGSGDIRSVTKIARTDTTQAIPVTMPKQVYFGLLGIMIHLPIGAIIIG